MQAQQERVEDHIIAAGSGGQVDLGKLVRSQSTAGARKSAGLDDPVGGAGGGINEPIGDRPVVAGARGGDDMLAGVTAATAVAARPGSRGDLPLHGLDVAGRDGVQSPLAPCRGHPVPVGAIRPASTGPRRRNNAR
ncbi:hypothetical protein Raf01_41850 [Rugosimonospora africana]|uniref:Uncharacterized protein n=1 Tax=Rugosimonospora africana TaxID=556532 RepID=A0A8J3QUK3_9ACTN|nr:hypothetical protein Raf01_41850 [Rugosimonospora africana]